MLLRLVYMSKSVKLMDQASLLDILTPARAFNQVHKISGLLLYKDQSFIQLLEGDPEHVDTLYRRISQDKRHFRVKTLIQESTSERLFGDWSMGFQNLDTYVPPSEVDGFSKFMTKQFDVSEFLSKPNESLELLLYFRAHS